MYIHYLVENKDGVYELIKSTSKVRDGLEVPRDPVTGKYEDASYLQIELYQNEDGSSQKRVTVNQQLKKIFEKDKKDKEQAIKDEKELETKVKEDLFNLDIDSIDDLDSIKDALTKIKAYLTK